MTPTRVTVFGSGLRRRDILETRDFETKEEALEWANGHFGKPDVGDITYEPIKETKPEREVPKLISRDEYLHGPDRD